MKLHVVTNDGTLVDEIEDIEQYDLDKPFARQSVVDDLRRIIELGRELEAAE